MLEHFLRGMTCDRLIRFINGNLECLTNIYDLSPLHLDWALEFDNEDVQVCGDIALTKYYDLSKDIGLGYEWKVIFDALNSSGFDADKILLGGTFGGKEKFNPGLMGSYFQGNKDVISNKEIIGVINKYDSTGIFDILNNMIDIAYLNQSGLYVTF